MQKIKTRNLLTVILSMLCAVTIALGVGFASPGFGKTAKAQTAANITSQIIYDGKDIFNDAIGGFDGDGLNALGAAVLGSGKKFDDLINYSGVKDATDIYNVASKDVVVKLGGFTWTPVYLSDSTSGDKVLTLWLTDSAQLTRAATPFAVNTSGAGWSGSGSYPSAMYGRSYVRINVLNAGGQWATSASALSNQYNQDPDNEWARFTMDQSALTGTKKSLTRFLAKPVDMEWQALESATKSGYTGFDSTHTTMANESYLKNGEKSFSGKTFTSSYKTTGANVESCSGYSDWKDDYVWLPSMVEIGQTSVNANAGSVWRCTATQRPSSADNFVRSMTYDYATRTFLVQSGGGIWYPQTTSEAKRVRPAIHLNLSKIGYIVSDVEVTYNGNVQDLSDVPAEQKGWIDETAMTVTPLTSNMKTAGTYWMKVELKPSFQSMGMKFLGDPDPDKGNGDESDTRRYFKFIIKPKLLEVPEINDNEQTYKGSEYVFDVSSAYKPSDMEIKRPNGITWDATESVYSDGLGWDSTDNQFKATNAGVYKVLFVLKDKTNTAWKVGDGTTDDRIATVTINKKALAFTFTATSSTMEWGLKEAGTVTLTPTVCTGDTVSLNVFYVNAAGSERKQGVTGHTLDISKISSIGTYTLCAKVITDKSDAGYVAGNDNYVIDAEDGVFKLTSAPINIKPGGISAENLSWQSRFSNELVGTAFNPGDLLSYYSDKKYVLTATGNEFMEVVTDYSTNDGYLNGFKTVDEAGNLMSGGECREVGKYKTYVAVHILSNDFAVEDVSKRLEGKEDDNKYGWLVLEWEIAPRELDFADAKWVYSTDGGEHWTIFEDSEPEYTGFNIIVKLDPDYIKSLGLDPDGTIDAAGTKEIELTYSGDTVKKEKKSYKASVGIVINHPNYTTPATSDGSDYSIEFEWRITNKQIGIKNWNGSMSVKDDEGRVFPVPVINATDGNNYSKYLVYTYTATLKDENGQDYTFTGTGEAALKTIAAQASSTNEIEVTATVSIIATQKDSFDLSGVTTKTFNMGSSKDAINVELTYNNVQYGDVKFGITATSGGVALDDSEMQFITLTVSSLLMSEPVTVQASNLSALMEHLVKVGDYNISLELGGMYADAFALFPSELTFTIVPKEVYIPEISREIIFTGENIKLENYLDGYDPTLMTLDALEKRDAGTVYTATITLKDQFNYVFVERPAAEGEAETTKKAVKIVLTGYENSVSFTDESHTAVEMKWQINPFVLDKSLWNLNGKEGASFNLPAQFAALLNNGELDLTIGYRYYEDANGGVVDPTFKSGSSYYVDAYLDGADAKNFVFENGTIVSEKTTYKVPKSGASAVMSNIKDFATKTWLGLPIWAWLLIALAVLILLIIIIVVAKKRRKSKEEKEEIKARKEEEKQRKLEEKERREEERRMQQEKLQAERELAMAKQQAELEKIRAQAGMAGAGMASMAMAQQAQPQQQAMPQQPQQQQPAQQQAQPVQQAMPTPMPQAMPAQQPIYVQQPSNSGELAAVLASMQSEIAQLRAGQNMQHGYSAPAGGGMGDYHSIYAEERARAAEARLSEERIRAEERARAAEQRAMLAEERYLRGGGMGGNAIPAEVVVALLQAVKGGNVVEPINVTPMPAPAPIAEIPQNVEESTVSAPTMYPADAVITTTTTVDTTKKDATTTRRERENSFADVDGFYDNID
ncbi:MAG: hypothetical protein K2N22_05820 [Clostridia bacterium]|nr:hypothetical protein [Clostridia bacterium]